MDKGEHEMKMSNQTYDLLKWLCLLVLPACSTFVAVVFEIWQIPFGTEIAQTITAVATLIGACLGVSSMNYYKTEALEMPEDETEVDNDEVGLG